MTKVLDQRKIEAALRIAAAKSGNREIQRGEVRAETRLADIAWRIKVEAATAITNWQTVEAFNNRCEGIDEKLRFDGIWTIAESVVKALVRDVTSALMRITDSPGTKDDLETLCRFVKMLADQDAQLISQRTGAEEELVANSVAFLRARVPFHWSKEAGNPGLTSDELQSARERFKPIRNSINAHAADSSQIDFKRDMPEIRKFLKVVSELADAACAIANIHRIDLNDHTAASLEAATRFWTRVHDSPASTALVQLGAES